MKAGAGRGFVSISPSWSAVVMGTISMIGLAPFDDGFVYSRKWWYALLIWFGRGHNFGVHAISNAPLLSLKTLQWIFGLAGCDLIS